MEYFKKKVSGDKKRFIENNYNLDLSYITPRIIAMAYPASGLETMYRNNIKDVSKFIREKHQTNYIVINLSGRQYDYSKFDNKVEGFVWVDHHAPPLSVIVSVCHKMKTFLDENIKNVVIVHCQAGKGRTGTIICSFFLLTGLFHTPEEALLYYSKKRFDKGEGVTQPAQKRYVAYFHSMLKSTYLYPYMINIFGLYVTKLPKAIKENFKPYLEFYNKNTEHLSFTTERPYFDQRKIFTNDEDVIIITEKSFSRQVTGDITIKLFNNEMRKSKEMGRISFNTAFLNPNETIMRFKLKEIDPDSLIYNKEIPPDFEIVLKYKPVCSCQKINSATDGICDNCIPLLQNELGEWKELNELIDKTKVSQEEGKILLFGEENDDFKGTLSHSVESFFNDSKAIIPVDNSKIESEDLNTSKAKECCIF